MRPGEQLTPAKITAVVSRFIAHKNGFHISYDVARRWPHKQWVLFQRMDEEFSAA